MRVRDRKDGRLVANFLGTGRLIFRAGGGRGAAPAARRDDRGVAQSISIFDPRSLVSPDGELSWLT